MLNFYDFEVFRYDWLVVIINPVTRTKEVIINDREKLERIFNDRKGEIWLGYNNRTYDQYIMRGILAGFNPKKVSDAIIVQGVKGFEYSTLLRKFPFINFDVMLRTDTGLKSLEGSMGNDIKETSVPFNVDRPLTKKEIAETVKYCTHDVEQTIETFLNRKEEFDAKMGLVKIFGLPLSYLGKTNAQLVAKICGGMGKKFNDEWDFPIAPTLRLFKYAHVKEWYLRSENHDYKKSQKVEVAGVPHVFAWGGIHGALKKFYGKGIFAMFDVTAYYPSLQMRYKWGYRNMANPENFERIHSENLRLKKIDKKKRLPYKIADNSMSGQLKDRYSTLYDPRDNNAICINGQLLLLDLIEKLEPHIKRLIQSNTDGILIELSSWDDFDLIDDIVWEWESRTGMRMGCDFYREVYQKDVNNYLLVGFDGSTKTKGAYTKSLSKLDYDLPIINRAMVAYMIDKVPVEDTMNDCDNLIDFQKIVKLSGKYDYVEHNGVKYDYKCYRVFASRSRSDGQILKCKRGAATAPHPWSGPGSPGSIRTGEDKKDKFANTPDRCFIENGNVNGVKVDSRLDRQWYVDLAKERLRQYGVII